MFSNGRKIQVVLFLFVCLGKRLVGWGEVDDRSPLFPSAYICIKKQTYKYVYMLFALCFDFILYYYSGDLAEGSIF